MSRTLDYYFSMVSPWAYIGHRLFREVVAANSVTVVHKPMVLGELFAETGGLPLQKRHPSRQKYRMMELQRWREKRGLDFHLQPKHWPFNSRLADLFVVAAIEKGLDPDGFIRLAFPAIWEQERDLADPATIKELGDKAGLPSDELLVRAGEPATSATFEQNRQDAIEAGVFGAPAYVLDGEVFWGQDRIELLADALKSGRRAYKPIP